MSDIIKLLPDSVANQIAAGEVIQRPASVIKELIENSLDAGATNVFVVIKDAGKTLIQVTDNGKGMSETDARMAFERHATSKIASANDLFLIKTMGFRGEALASVAAVADVELKTRTVDSDLGTRIHIKGSDVIVQEPIQNQVGSSFAVRNLFFNIPARRKFLKGDNTEFGHIKTEFIKTALAYPEVDFTLIHNDLPEFKLPVSNFRQRVVGIFGRAYNTALVPVQTETSILTINGFVGKPELAKKRNTEQYFFVNKRFMRHSYFYKAVLSAYEGLISGDSNPSFFLNFDIDPARIDINIHPQKTEINFDDTQGIFSILRAAVKEALGKHNVVPSIDFDQDGADNFSFGHKKNDSEHADETFSKLNTDVFNTTDKSQKSNFQTKNFTNPNVNYTDNLEHWEKLYKDFETNNVNKSLQPSQLEIADTDVEILHSAIQFGKKYIATSVKSGLMLINYKRAQERILFEALMEKNELRPLATQQLLYPKEMPMEENDYANLLGVRNVLLNLGIVIEAKDADTILVTAYPPEFSDTNPKEILEELVYILRDEPDMVLERVKEWVCETAVRKLASKMYRKLSNEELQDILNKLFTCRIPNYTNDGRTIISKLDTDEIESRFE